MPSYPQRQLGDDKVSAQGLGCMGMSQAYSSFGGYDDPESLATLTAAADMGITFVSSCVIDHLRKGI
jgi:aryl-alcohol dehydrogenase-like predicted oxidoreductase